MTKALCSYPQSEREEVVRRRIKNESLMGLGYWAAFDYEIAKGKTPKVKKPKVHEDVEE